MATNKEYPKNFGFSDEYEFTKDTPIFEYHHFFSSEEARIKAKRFIDEFREGELHELEETFGHSFAGLYVGGTYKKVLRLYSRVPTFDESDREFDSYRVIVFIRDKFNRYYLAKYSGGSTLAELIIYGELIRFPKEYEELLK